MVKRFEQMRDDANIFKANLVFIQAEKDYPAVLKPTFCLFIFSHISTTQHA